MGSVILMGIFSVFLAPSIYAQSNQTSYNQTVRLDGSIVLPDQDVTINGSGEPGSRVVISVYKDQSLLFSLTSTVNANGQWQATLPNTNGVQPTDIVVQSQISLTSEKIIETIGMTAVTATTSLVLLELFAERALRFFQLLGLLGRRKTKGFVFDVTTKKPISFAILTIESILKKGQSQAQQLTETVVTTVDGFFKSVELPPGRYQITAAHPYYRFPVLLTRPWYSNPLEFYKGEIIELDKAEQLGFLVVPMQPVSGKKQAQKHWFQPRVIGAIFNQILQAISIPMAVISILILLRFPSFINFAITTLYLVVFSYEFFRRSKLLKLAGKITDNKGQPLAETLVRVFELPTQELAGVVLTNRRGHFSLRLRPHQYQVAISKDGYIAQGANNGLSFETLNLEKGKRDLNYTLVPAPTYTSQASAPAQSTIVKVSEEDIFGPNPINTPVTLKTKKASQKSRKKIVKRIKLKTKKTETQFKENDFF